MKSIHLFSPIALAILVSTTLSGCAPRSTQDAGLPENMPNKMVSLETKVTDEDFLNLTQTSEIDPVTSLEPEEDPVSNAPATFTLAEQAKTLGEMAQADYLLTQVRWVGSDYPACNFFLITALCESGYCTRQKPFYKAADFDDYFIRENWKQVSLADLRIKALANETMDVVFQKEGVTPDKPGHVVILVGYNQHTRRFIIAEGSLGTITNTVKEVSDNFLLSWNGGFKIFVRQPESTVSTGEGSASN